MWSTRHQLEGNDGPQQIMYGKDVFCNYKTIIAYDPRATMVVIMLKQSLHMTHGPTVVVIMLKQSLHMTYDG